MATKPSNYEAALRAEAKRVIRCFHRHDHITRANMMASHRLGYRQRESTGDFFYIHPDAPGIAFRKRFEAARHVVEQAA